MAYCWLVIQEAVWLSKGDYGSAKIKNVYLTSDKDR